MTSFLSRSIFAVLVAMTWACSAKQSPFHSLSNEGVLTLSTANPYLGSNLFLAERATESEYLYQFLEGRGAPSAIQLKENDERIHLYYPKEKEIYVADRARNKEWIVRGPYGMRRNDYRTFVSVRNSEVKPPVFVIDGELHRFHQKKLKEQTRVISPSIVVLPPPQPPAPKPAARKIITVKKNEQIGVDSKASNTPAVLNSDQKAIEMSRNFAERNSSGDLIHVCVSDGETLESVVTWYTTDKDNLEKVAAANTLGPESKLKKGQKIIISQMLLKNLVAKK